VVTAPYASTYVKVYRVKYEFYKPSNYYNPHSDPVKDFLIDQVPDIAIGEQKAAAKRVMAKYDNSWEFKNTVFSTVLSTIVFRRLKMENRENMAAVYLEDKYSDYDENTGEYREFGDDFDRDVFTAIFGPEGITRISDIPKEPLIERLFLFLTAAGLKNNCLPGLNDSDKEWEKTEKSLFWKFAQMTREEYIIMYREILSATIRNAISEPAGKEREKDD
jgi:hypothetical protein